MRAVPTIEAAPRPLPTPPRWVRDIVVAVLVIVPAFAPVPFPELRPSGALVYAFALLPAAVLPFRRRWPRSALAVCIALYVAALALGTLAPGAALAVVIAAYGVPDRLDRRAAAPVSIAAVAVVVTASVVVELTTGMDTRFLQIGLSVALAGALGDATRSRRAYVLAVIERARRAEQTREAEASRRVTEERLRIARDLHDAVAHQISVISLNAGVASSALESRPGRAREALATIRTASRDVLGEIGSMLTVLRTPDELDAREQPGLARLGDIVESVRVAGWDVVVRDERDEEPLPLGVDIVAYRVVQEGLTNALKHGAARRVHVLLRRDEDCLEIVVTNPLDRIPSDPDLPPSGFGLLGLRERVDSVGGGLEAGPAPGGFRLAARLPLSPHPPQARPAPGGAS
ncbi:sensor histidine kinase [Microbacterium enclense]|uniref:sensor histidine kinase n=1 Tax=Microbacterium enclense TaxID=993073 RepID=UPI0021A56D57|nr:sensor histidine kinase [Microbacterium enclense]MCT2086033.1 sensor histidine kinase [Microbacterium enclense]